MDPQSTTATTQFDLLGLPLELRDDVYEFAVFDLSPPEMVIFPPRTTTVAYRHMNTNLLLTSRKMYWEVRNMIVRRGRLVMVSATYLHSLGLTQRLPHHMSILTHSAGISVIHPKYRNLCIMDHRIDATRSASRPPNEGGYKWEFIIHQRDIHTFCHSLMGKFDKYAESMLGPKSTHTLVLHCPPNYAQHEQVGVIEMQTQVLQLYRRILRGFEDLSIRGTSTGWESGLYSATLRDIRSVDARRELQLAEFVDGYMDELHALKKEGLDTLSQTGDLEAANASWMKALGICQQAKASINDWYGPPRPYYERTRHASDSQKWGQLIRAHGSACVVPIVNFWQRLLVIRLSEVLRLVQRGGHLRLGRRSTRPWNLADFMEQAQREWRLVAYYFEVQVDGWVPETSVEIQMCCTVAAVLRLLDEKTRSLTAMEAMERAWLISSHVDAIQQEAVRQEMFRFSSWLLNYRSAPAMA